MKVLCILALGLAVVAAELSVDVTQELDRMARPEDRSVTAYSHNSVLSRIEKFDRHKYIEFLKMSRISGSDTQMLLRVPNSDILTLTISMTI